MKKLINSLMLLSIIFSATFFMQSCDPDNPVTPDQVDQALGWFGLGGENGDNLESIEDDINFGTGEIAESIDFSNKFPPIGNQGSYGTCVAWAVGYNHKTYLEAAGGTSKPTSTSEQFSPKYLFWAVPSASKGADCNGTGFEPAYDVLISKGISTLAETPYTNMGDCSGSVSSWDANAENHKILSYREIDVDKNTLKGYLSQRRAISFGAKLGDEFMNANSSDVLYSQSYGYTGQHAYHAMTLCGYDNNKGTNGAFRVVNSWGPSWGDNGYLWVDEEFFVSGDFCFCAFVATDASNPDGDGDGDVDDPNSGMDLTAWELYDSDNGGRNRIAKYNAFNSGEDDVPASKDWNILYIYYDAYDAENYGIILYDYYSDDYGNQNNYWSGFDANNNGTLDPGENTLGNNGAFDISSYDGTVTVPQHPSDVSAMGYWWNNVNSVSGNSIAYDIYHNDPVADRFYWPYTMPEITGFYYLVVIVDGFDDISESDESNNYFYLTNTAGEPIHIIDGVIQDELPSEETKSWVKNMNPQMGDDSPMQTVKNENNLNTYSPSEIRAMIVHQRETGELQNKVYEFIKNNKNVNKKTNN